MLPVFAPLAPLRALFPTDEHRVSASFLTPLLCKLCVYSTLLSSSLYVSVCVCVFVSVCDFVLVLVHPLVSVSVFLWICFVSEGVFLNGF